MSKYKCQNILFFPFLTSSTAWKVSLFVVFIVRIFPHSNWLLIINNKKTLKYYLKSFVYVTFELVLLRNLNSKNIPRIFKMFYTTNLSQGLLTIQFPKIWQCPFSARLLFSFLFLCFFLVLLCFLFLSEVHIAGSETESNIKQEIHHWKIQTHNQRGP